MLKKEAKLFIAGVMVSWAMLTGGGLCLFLSRGSDGQGGLSTAGGAVGAVGLLILVGVSFVAFRHMKRMSDLVVQTANGDINHGRKDVSGEPGEWGRSSHQLADRSGFPQVEQQGDTSRRTTELETIIEANPSGIMLVDVQTRQVVRVNHRACQMSGHTHEQIIGHICHDCICPAEKDRCPILDLKQTVDVSERMLKKADGSKLPILKSVIPIQIDGRDLLLETFIDVSDQQRGIQEKTAHLERDRKQKTVLVELASHIAIAGDDLMMAFRAITEATAQALQTHRVSIWLFNSEKTEMQCVSLFDARSNTHSSDLGSLKTADFPLYFQSLTKGRAITAHDACTDPRTAEFTSCYLIPQNIKSMLDAIIRMEGDVAGVVCHEHTGVQRYWMADEATFAGEIADLVVHAIMVHKQKMANQALGDNRELLVAILESSGDGVLVVDECDHVVHCNGRFREMWGLPDVLPGQAICKEILTAIREQLVKDPQFTEHFEAQRYFLEKFNLMLQCKDGRIIDQLSSPLMRNGKLSGRVLSFRDVTDLYRMEQHLQQAQKMESVGQLASGIAHEINTPTQYVGDNAVFVQDSFAAIVSLIDKQRQALEACKSGPLPAAILSGLEELASQIDLNYLLTEIPKALEQAVEGVERVASIARAMKEFAHPGNDDKNLVDINRAIESTLTVARNEWKYVAELKTDFDADMPMVYCMPGPFNQVILNMVVNAAHAIADRLIPDSDQRGVITITTQRMDHWAEIRIGDTGTGITPEHLPHIFESFFTTKKLGKGSGQGLAIAHSVVVEKHGGTIDVETEVGKGTIFIIRLPIGNYAENAQQESAIIDG